LFFQGIDVSFVVSVKVSLINIAGIISKLNIDSKRKNESMEKQDLIDLQIKEIDKGIDAPPIQSVVSPCDFSDLCESPSQSPKWACSGFITKEDRLKMCVFFYRFQNPREKPEWMDNREWIRRLRQEIRANRTDERKAHETNRGKNR
jgi:hypothetical protein